jgi:protein O-GlcNAc transferase
VTIPQALDLALQHHRAGRLAEAEAIYRQILAAQPKHAGARHLLGLAAHQTGRGDFAVECIREAIALDPNDPLAYSNLGECYRSLGRFDEAVASFRRALELKPDYPEAHNNLANALLGRGRLDEAVAACHHALRLKPGYPEAHNNLGAALAGQGRLDEAIAAYRRALELKPDFPEACNNLGAALAGKGRLDEAIAAYRRALEFKPGYPEALNNLGNAFRERGQLDEAAAAYRRALQFRPGYPEAYNNLGNALRDLAQFDEAIAAYRRALEVRPDYPEAYNNLGNALRGRGQCDEAMTAYRRALELRPDYPEAHNNLGLALSDAGHIDEAIAAYRRAIQFKPDFPVAHYNLGAALAGQRLPDEAVVAYRRALELKPDYAEAHNNLGITLKDLGQLDEAIAAFHRSIQSGNERPDALGNLIYTLHFHPGYSGRMISEEHQRWNRQFADPLKRLILSHSNDPATAGRLRIGYVSPEFRDHVTGRYLLPLFKSHDHRDFEILCYSGVTRADALTEEFRRCADRWRSTVSVSDEALAEMIRQDGVDILVDLTQHMAGNRLTMFARKPAPVQVSFAGYPDSTGLETIEYRISDRYLEGNSPDGQTGRHERVSMIDSFWCYDPCGIEVEVNGLPARESGGITFGSLNNFCKVNAGVLSLWARVLGSVAGSRLIILAGEGSHRRRTVDALEREGVEARRVEFVEFRPRREYLELYHRLDVALDTFPSNGHTTSLDALWMGVPVVSLVGDTPVSRAGLSQLTNLGLPELVARSEDEYVVIAKRLAGDLPRLAALRSTLRDRMKVSVLMDAPRFARNIEAAYRAIWERWRR